MRSTDSRAQIEKLYKTFQLETEAMRAQYEDRMEQMKITSTEQVNTKKA